MLSVAESPAGGVIITHLYRVESGSALGTTYFYIALLA